MIPLVYNNIKQDLYYIEEDGRIYSKAKRGYLTPKLDKDGYLYVQLQRPEGGRNNRIAKRIALLVAVHYIGLPPIEMKDPTINHIDGNKMNNHYSNLEWMERGLNSSIRNNKGQGSSNHEAKLNEQQVIKICELLINTNLTFTEIANQFGVTKSTINNIRRKKNWKYITDNYDFSCRQLLRNSKGQFEIINIKFLEGDGNEHN